MQNEYDEMKHFIDLVDKMNKETGELNEASKQSPRDKLEKDLSKTDDKIMQEKLKKLNMLIKKKYYDKDSDTPEENMFQFHFQDRGDHYEFNIPLNILFGKKTREFCAKYWDNFFDQADIDTSFNDNIEKALKQAGNINLTMNLNKKLTKEVEDEKSSEEEE